MKVLFWLLFIVSFGVHAENDTICELSEKELKFAELTDSYIYRDKDYSAENAIKSLEIMVKYYKGEKLKYFIPRNHMTIINGAILLDKINVIEKRLKEAKEKNYDKVVREQEVALLEHTNKYCNYLRSHYSIDW